MTWDQLGLVNGTTKLLVVVVDLSPRNFEFSQNERFDFAQQNQEFLHEVAVVIPFVAASGNLGRRC